MFDPNASANEQTKDRCEPLREPAMARMKAEGKRQREDFVHALKHKLLTPVLADKRVVELLHDGAYGQVGEQQLKILKLLSANAEKLIADIESMLEAYLYQDGLKKLQMRSRPVAWLLKEVANRLSAQAAERRIELKVECDESDGTIECDPDEICTLIAHLADNALRFAKSTVRLVTRMSAEQREVIISVEDDGGGISSEDAVHLFDRFYRFSASGRYPAATGVGLFLCYQIATAHGGTIACSSEPGRGTTFTVTLPREARRLNLRTGV